MNTKCEDFRIGNKILSGHFDHATTIVGLTPSECITIDGQHWPYELINGLTITNEILLSAGFEREIRDGMDVWSISISKERSYLDWHDDGSLLFRNDNSLVDCSADVKYLHELQNVYFALTGKELNLGKQ